METVNVAEVQPHPADHHAAFRHSACINFQTLALI